MTRKQSVRLPQGVCQRAAGGRGGRHAPGDRERRVQAAPGRRPAGSAATGSATSVGGDAGHAHGEPPSRERRGRGDVLIRHVFARPAAPQPTGEAPPGPLSDPAKTRTMLAAKQAIREGSLVRDVAQGGGGLWGRGVVHTKCFRASEAAKRLITALPEVSPELHAPLPPCPRAGRPWDDPRCLCLQAVRSAEDGLAVIGDMLKGRMLQVVDRGSGPRGGDVGGYLLRFAEDAPPPQLGEPLNAPFTFSTAARPAVQVSQDLRRQVLKLYGKFLSEDGRKGEACARDLACRVAHRTLSLTLGDVGRSSPREANAYALNACSIVSRSRLRRDGSFPGVCRFCGGVCGVAGGGPVGPARERAKGLLHQPLQHHDRARQRGDRGTKDGVGPNALLPWSQVQRGWSGVLCGRHRTRHPPMQQAHARLSGEVARWMAHRPRQPHPPTPRLPTAPAHALAHPCAQWALLGMPQRARPLLPPGDRRLHCMLHAPVDPRIHFALVCGAKSCPPIRVFDGGNVDRALAAAAEGFLENETQVDERAGVVTTSMILKARAASHMTHLTFLRASVWFRLVVSAVRSPHAPLLAAHPTPVSIACAVVWVRLWADEGGGAAGHGQAHARGIGEARGAGEDAGEQDQRDPQARTVRLGRQLMSRRGVPVLSVPVLSRVAVLNSFKCR